MKHLNLIIALQLCFICNGPGAEHASNLAIEFSARPIAEKTMQNLPKGREQETLEALLKQPAPSTLLRLNHAPTVEKQIQKYVISKGMDLGAKENIRRSGAPQLIEKIAPMLYKTDVIEPRTYGEGTQDLGESVAAAETIGQLVIKAPEFTPKVKEWAKQHIDHAGPNIIQLARQFWETNIDAFKTGNFSRVVVPGSAVKETLLGPASSENENEQIGQPFQMPKQVVGPDKGSSDGATLYLKVVNLPLWWIFGPALVISAFFIIAVISKKLK